MQICTLDVVFQPFCGKPEVLKVHMHLMSLHIQPYFWLYSLKVHANKAAYTLDNQM